MAARMKSFNPETDLGGVNPNTLHGRAVSGLYSEAAGNVPVKWIDQTAGTHAKRSRTLSKLVFCCVVCAHLVAFAALPERKPALPVTKPKAFMVRVVSAPVLAPSASQQSLVPAPSKKANPLSKPKALREKTTKIHAKALRPASKRVNIAPSPPEVAKNQTEKPVLAEPKPGHAQPKALAQQPMPNPAKQVAAQSSTANRAASFNAAYLHNPAPKYPTLSRRLGEQGVVYLSVLVTAKGAAASVDLKTSIGWSRLDQAAVDCVKNWRFAPAQRAGKPISAGVIIPIRFSLKG